MGYSLIIVNSKEVKHDFRSLYNFNSREEAERFAEGISIGLHLERKKWGVVMLLNDKYDHCTKISKNLSNRQTQILFHHLNETGRL